MKSSLRLFSIVFTCVAASAAADDAPVPIEPESVQLGRPVEFQRDVRPILDANCMACHSRSSDESDLALETVETMLKGGGRGPAIVPGKADDSLLFTAAAHRREPIMPPADNDVKAKDLTPHELGILHQWIQEGAKQGEAASAMIGWRPLPEGYRPIHSVALSPSSRFVAASRGNQVELYDLVAGGPPVRLVDPALTILQSNGTPIYPNGAADRDIIQAVAFSPDGKTLATGGYRSIRLWHRDGLSEIGPQFDVAGVHAIAGAADGSAIAVAAGAEVKVVANDGSSLATWTVPTKAIAITISGDGQRVAAVCEDHSIHEWSRVSGTEATVRTSPAVATAIALVGDRIATARDSGIIDIWSPGSAQPERELKGQVGRVTALVPTTAVANGLLSAGDDGMIRVWDITNETPLRTIAHGSPIIDLAVTSDGSTIACCSADGTVRFWKASDGAKIGEAVGSITRRADEQRAAESLEWRKQIVAVAGGRIKEAEAAVNDRDAIQKKAVEARTAAEAALAEANKAAGEAASAAQAAAAALAAKADDAALKTQAEESKKKADEATAKATAATEAMRSADRAVTLADEALKTQRERLATQQQAKAGADEAVKAADTELKSKQAAASQPLEAKAIGWSPEGERFVVSYADATLQTFSATGQPVDAFTVPESVVDLCCGASRTVVGLCSDGTLRRLDVIGDWKFQVTLGPPADRPLDVGSSEIADRVLALQFSPDGLRLASGGGEPSRLGELLLWNVKESRLERRIADPHSDTIQAISFSRDGRTVATAGADKFVKTFDVATGEFQHSFEGHTDQVLGVSLKADGTSIASASADLGIKIWDAASGEQRRTVKGHGKQVTAVHFAGLSEDFVTGAGDNTVRLFRASNGQQLRTFAGPSDYVHSVAISGDGSVVVAGGEDGVLFVWDGKNASVRQRFEPPSPSTGEATAAK